jgi:hypothetical protein
LPLVIASGQILRCAARISTTPLLFDELVKDREKERHRLASAGSPCSTRPRDSRLRYLAGLMDPMPEAPTAQTTRPPQRTCGVDRGDKRKSCRTRKGNVWLRAALIESAQSLGRGRGTNLAAQYRRLTARRGKKKAAVALGHSILVIVYHLLSRGEVLSRSRRPVLRRTSTRVAANAWSTPLRTIDFTRP